MRQPSLAIDIGNTNIVIGLFPDQDLLQARRHETRTVLSAEDALRILDRYHSKNLRHAVLSSVVPRLTPFFRRALTGRFGIRRPVCVTHRTDTGIRIDIDRPEQLGADRIVNAAYGYHRFGGPLLLLDFGTATTLCNVTRDGRYIGGAILPGLQLGAESLVRRAAKLRSIRFEGRMPVMGRNTEESMRIGLVKGHAGAVMHVGEAMLRRTGPGTRVIATGGLAGFMKSHVPFIDTVEPDLTLLGLHYILERQSRT